MLKAVSLLVALCGACALAERPIINTSPSALMPILRGEGYTTTLDKSRRNPVLHFKYDGYSVELEFVGCVNTACRIIYATHGFDLKDGIDAATVNDWNRKNFSVVYRDRDGDPFIQSAYTLVGGVTKTNLLTWLRFFLNDMTDFSEQLPETSDPPTG